MTARRKRSSIAPLLKHHAGQLTQAIRALGDYSHVTVRPAPGRTQAPTSPLTEVQRIGQVDPPSGENMRETQQASPSASARS